MPRAAPPCSWRRRPSLRGRTTGSWPSASRRCPRASSARHSSPPGRSRPGSRRRRPTSRSGPSGCWPTPDSPSEHLAQVVVKNRRHGVDNPDAMFRKPVTIDEVLSARMICPPLTLFMLCSPNEGAAAVVLRAATGDGGDGRRRQAGRHLPPLPPPRQRPRRGFAAVRDRRRRHHARRPHWRPTMPTPRPGSGPTTSTSSSARTPMPPANCWPGPSSACASRATRPAILAHGDAMIGGRLPINPSGGLLSKGEPLGASALGQVVELVRQLRGTAGRPPGGGGTGRAGPRDRAGRQRLRHRPRPLTVPRGRQATVIERNTSGWRSVLSTPAHASGPSISAKQVCSGAVAPPGPPSGAPAFPVVVRAVKLPM